MAQIIDIHPVRFNYEQNCSLRDGGYRQIVKQGDVTQFQLGMEPCPPELNLVSNPVFNTTAEWFVTNPATAYIDTVNGLGVKVALGGAGGLYQFIAIPAGRLVLLTFTLDIIAGEMQVLMGTYSEYFDTSGTYTRWVDCSGSLVLRFEGISSSAWTITGISMLGINTHFALQVVETTLGVVRVIDSQIEPSYFDIVRGWLTVSYDWTDSAGDPLPDGCYYLEVADPCYCGNFGFLAEDFYTIKNQWQGGSLWSFGIGVAQFSGAANSTTKISNALCAGTSYTVTYTLTGMDASSKFWVRVGAVLGTLRTTDGTYTEVITANMEDFHLVGGTTGAATTYEVTNLSVRATTPVFSITSNLFSLRTYIPCSFLLSACCDEDNLQAGYGDTGFSPRVRLIAEYGQGGNTGTSGNYKDSYGRKSSYYYTGDEYKSFAYSSSKYIHDFTGHLKGYDHVYIDANEVVVDDEEPPTIAWVPRYDIGERIFALSDKVTRIVKRRYTSAINGCSRGGLPLGADGGGVLVISGEELLGSG
jgi:hypothetical protein